LARKAEFDEETLIAANEESVFLAKAEQPVIQEKQTQLAERMRRQEKDWNVYGGPISSFGSVETKGDQVGIGYATVGALAGFDTILSPSRNVGVGSVLQYRKQWGHAHDGGSTLDNDLIHGSIYGTAILRELPALSFDGIVGSAYSWDALTRKAGVNRSLEAKAHTNETIFDFLFDIEYQISKENISRFPRSLSLVPFASVQYIHDRIGGYTEEGAGNFSLQAETQNLESLTTVLGLWLAYLLMKPTYTLRTEAVAFTPFNVTTIPTVVFTEEAGKNSLLLGLDLLATFWDGWQAEANGNYQLNSLFYDVSFYLGIGKEF